MYKRVQFIELVKEIMFLISVWDEKEEKDAWLNLLEFSHKI